MQNVIKPYQLKKTVYGWRVEVALDGNDYVVELIGLTGQMSYYLRTGAWTMKELYFSNAPKKLLKLQHYAAMAIQELSVANSPEPPYMELEEPPPEKPRHIDYGSVDTSTVENTKGAWWTGAAVILGLMTFMAIFF